MSWSIQDSTSSTADNPVDIADMLNRYFYSVFQTPDLTHNQLFSVDFEDDMIDLTTISDLTLTEGEVRYVLRNLDEEKATGPDNIPAVLLKNCAASIAPSLCELFNKSLSSGHLPSEWKLSNICPIPKKSPLHEVSNYRPISLLSLVSKVFERCIYNRLIDHISSKLNELQYGFQRGKSTTSQLLHVLHNIHKMLEKRCQVDTIYLDFAKAFDKVSHDLLLVKLHNFGIKGNLLRWFKNYLSGRFQRVTVHGVTSQPLPVLSGVPQGSILGPILFLIYVNDLPDSVSQGTAVSMFADYTKCHRAVRNPQDREILQSDLNNITNWCQDWRMDLNKSKCGVLQFTRCLQPTINQYTLVEIPVKPLTCVKDLGVSITKDMKWNQHVQDLSSKANKMLGFVKRTASGIHDKRVRKILYLTIVPSQLAYSSQVWAPQTVNNILTIERLQRRASKFILSLPYKTSIPYKKRLATIGILPLCYWHEYLDMVYLHKCLINNSDNNISIKIPTRETRNTSSTNGILLHVTKSKTVSFQNSFYIRAANVWNTLPGFIRNTTTSLTTFKCYLMKYYVELTQQIYDPEDPRTFKSVCIKCHTSRPLMNLSTRTCC